MLVIKIEMFGIEFESGAIRFTDFKNVAHIKSTDKIARNNRHT